jgi:DNA-binding NarL/FixJ family response regulator
MSAADHCSGGWLMVHVMIADDHRLVREGMRKILATSAGISLGCEAEDGDSTLELISKHQCACNLLILDWSMPGGGENLIRRIKTLRPELAILIVSMHNEAIIAHNALKAGANGYVTKDSDPETLIYAVQHVSAGRQFIDPTLVAKVLSVRAYSPMGKLTEREQEIFQLLVNGSSVSEIARSLNISIKTVSTHKCNLMLKLNVNSLAELVRHAIQEFPD